MMVEYKKFGKTGLQIPPIIFGTSALGNLYTALSNEVKLNIVSESLRYVPFPVFDSAGKYGAGLSLEMLGKCLNKLQPDPDSIVISNKLGWIRTALTTPEPTFEQGVWRDLEHDARQNISYDGIMTCFNQGNELLGGTYKPKLVSVHDPDEYIHQAGTKEEKDQRFKDILEAYKALADLKKQGKVKAIGVGSKDWKIIKQLSTLVAFDWVMFANSLTIMNHPPELLEFMEELHRQDVGIINSAVFHGGFLTGSNYYDYKFVTPETDLSKFKWRAAFYELCKDYKLSPAQVCVNFAMTAPGVAAISLNTSDPARVKVNVEAVTTKVPGEFYAEMVRQGLISKDYPYLGL